MLKQLKNYYESNGISAINFRCKHEGNCRGSYADFTTAKEAFLGPEYEKGSIPRLLFLSLDSGGENKDPVNRTMEKLREDILKSNVSKFHKGRHWYLTHKLAFELLKQFKEDLSIDNIATYFAHTNSAKCCMNKKGSGMAEKRLFSNCREYLTGEIAILKPDILVTQGKEARLSIEDIFTNRIETYLPSEQNDLCKLKVIRLTEKHKTLWIPTHHPRAGRLFRPQQRECWSIYKNKVMEFMKKIIRAKED